MTVEERLAQLEEIIEIMMDDPVLRHKIAVAKFFFCFERYSKYK